MIPILKNKLADTGNKFFSLYAIIDTNIQFWTAIYQTATYNILQLYINLEIYK